MSLFGKLKQMAGIGTLDVRVEGPTQFMATDAQVSGIVHITAKSEQQVLSLTVELREEYSSGRDEEKKEQRFVLGSQVFGEQYVMKEGETRAIPFTLPIKLVKSGNDTLKERGGLLGGLGKMGTWANAEKSTYKLHALVDVKGTSLDPSGELDVKMTK